MAITWKTPTDLANRIGLRFSDLDDGEQGFQAALDSARHEITFRLGEFWSQSYVERERDGTDYANVKLLAAESLAPEAQIFLAGSKLYMQFSQTELQFGASGNPFQTPDFGVGAFTPEKNVQSAEYARRAEELRSQYESIMSIILPKTNLPYLAFAKGRSDYSATGDFWGADKWI